MCMALNKFQAMKQSNEWNAATSPDERIYALEMQMKKKSGKGQPPAKKGSKPAKHQKEQKEQKDQKTTYPKTPYPAWSLVPPASGDTKCKEVKGKEYHWCIKH